ncbi:hypothetical protein EVAR_75231_1 [Eumeta japonica]|uniref:Uncharacterized protein n=1 Tax=Eumeta variegata TaxID=151549 RepID=A0A4C1V8K0_EUMVA|nr:hypothetical protein EVAR_75231_1 [Eumeta japonica]
MMNSLWRSWQDYPKAVSCISIVSTVHSTVLAATHRRRNQGVAYGARCLRIHRSVEENKTSRSEFELVRFFLTGDKHVRSPVGGTGCVGVRRARRAGGGRPPYESLVKLERRHGPVFIVALSPRRRRWPLSCIFSRHFCSAREGASGRGLGRDCFRRVSYVFRARDRRPRAAPARAADATRWNHAEYSATTSLLKLELKFELELNLSITLFFAFDGFDNNTETKTVIGLKPTAESQSSPNYHEAGVNTGVGAESVFGIELEALESEPRASCDWNYKRDRG